MKFLEILAVATLVTGFIALLDRVYFSKRREASSKEGVMIEYSKSFFPILFVVLLLRAFVAEPFRIPSGSMKPTLIEGDLILVTKYNYGIRIPRIGTKLIPTSAPKRGDIIVFAHDNNQDLIKRVVGIPGDKILYKNSVLYINGEPVAMETTGRSVDEDVVNGINWPVVEKQETLDKVKHNIYLRSFDNGIYNYPYSEVTVPNGSYYVLGDNRDGSNDSRYWGFVDEKKILGKAIFTWMNWDSKKNFVRWERVGKKIN